MATRLRSVLYIPGANSRAMEKARMIPADGFILDLEDAVVPSAKKEARTRVCDAVADRRYGPRTVAIRVNGIGTEWHALDLEAAAAAAPDAILIPKVNSAGDLQLIEQAIARAGAPDHVDLWAMLETPRSVLHAAEICSSTDRLSVVVVGTNDLANELRANLSADRSSLVTNLSLCVLGARAAGKTILDGVFNDVRDLDAFERESGQARQLGFDGKTLIHPAQVEICNRVFSPSAEEFDAAHRIVAAFEDAQRHGSGVATVDGRMIENLHVDNARRVLAAGDVTGSD